VLIEEVSQMIETGTAIRRILAAASAVAALALLAGTSPAPAISQSDSPASQAAKVEKVSSKKVRDSKVTTSVRAAATVASATDYTSIFAEQQPSMIGSGWAACAAAITWTVDASDLSAAEAERQIANLQASFDQWAEATGLSFSFAGAANFRYNEAAFTLTRTDGSPNPSRSISLAFIDDADSDRLGGQTVGMAGPTTVWMDSKIIESGTGVFRTDAVKKMSDTEAQALFTHELGHVLGLGHAAESGNIMYPVVSTTTSLGAGDVTGARSMLKTCAA
jgi:Zn-dependent protease with chaperone function